MAEAQIARTVFLGAGVHGADADAEYLDRCRASVIRGIELDADRVAIKRQLRCSMLK